jgi:rsbT co-antagonist protein RsbR
MASRSIKATLDACPVALFVASDDGTLEERSAAFVRRFGDAHARLVEVAAPEARDDLAAFLAGLEAGGDGEEHVFAAATGERLRCRAGRAEDGTIHGVVDEVGPAPAPVEEAQLARIEQRLLKAMLEVLDIAVWAVDRSGIFVFHDGGGLSKVGLKPGQFVGMNVFDLYPEELVKEVRQVLKGARLTNETESHDARWNNWMLPLEGPDDAVEYVVGLSLDVSEARRRETELEQRLATIKLQNEAIQELSTPVIEVWDKVLVAPLVGVIDTDRARSLSDRTLGHVSRTGAEFVLIDLTGVEVLDTSTASHLVRLLACVRLLGAEGLITGISSHVAQTIVGIGVDLTAIRTYATVRDGLRYCMASK